jgi:hypothetical protein
MNSENKKTIGRRAFLRTLGAGAGVAASAATPLAKGAVAAEKEEDRRKARYRETEHVKTFYKVNRYPS